MRKKVLIMNLTPRGGMLDYSSQFSNALGGKDNINMRVAIASYYSSTLYHPDTKFIKIRTVPNAINFIFDTVNIFYHTYFIFQIIRFKPDIVHFLDNHPWYVFYGKLFKFFGYKIYVTQHDPTLHSGESTTLLGSMAIWVNATLRNIGNKIYVHGDGLRAEMIHKYKIAQDRVVNIRHGNYNFLKDVFSQGGNTQKNTFLFFGRILDYKGLDILLDSLNIVKRQLPNFKLIIAGPGDISKYQTSIKKHHDYVEVINTHIYPEEIYKYFEACEFVVLPYRDATGSGVIPVAYAFSKAVLVTNVGELASVVTDGKTGHIIDPNSSESLGNKIVEMLEQKDTVITMGKNGRNFSDQQLGWDNIVNTIYEK